MPIANENAGQRKAETVEAILLTLKVASKQSLFVLLTSDGTVNRMGTGAVDNQERDMYIGVIKEPLFKQARAKIIEEWFDHLGAYDVPNKKGQPCELTIIMKHADGKESALQFRYGSESQGPPDDICDFVGQVVSLTEPWYEEQKNLAPEEGSSPNKR